MIFIIIFIIIELIIIIIVVIVVVVVAIGCFPVVSKQISYGVCGWFMLGLKLVKYF